MKVRQIPQLGRGCFLAILAHVPCVANYAQIALAVHTGNFRLDLGHRKTKVLSEAPESAPILKLYITVALLLPMYGSRNQPL